MTSEDQVPPTERQKEVLQYILDYLCENGYQPSVRECVARFGYTAPNSMVEMLASLTIKGYVAIREPGRHSPARAVRILRLPDGTPFRGLSLNREGS